MVNSTCQTPGPLRYDDLKKRQLDGATSTQIFGVLVDLGRSDQTVQPYHGLIPIYCFCVQDSPENPCPCRWIIWLPKALVLESGKTDLKTKDGHEIHYFNVCNTAYVVMEKHESVSILDYAQSLNGHKDLAG